MPASSPPRARAQRLLLGLLLAALALPALQAKWPLVPVSPLSGYTDAAPTAHLSWAGLWDTSFQTQLENYLNERLGFRPWLVRLRNQVAYSLWHELLTPALVLGPDENIYQQGPANAYLGRNFLGEAELAKRARHLRQVQDTLQAHGTQLLFLIAPGKTRILPETLNDTSATQPKGPTNYDVVRAQFARYGVHTLDAAPLLQRWRAAGGYPLFPRTGTHWSGYAVARVADTLFHRLESLTGRDLPDFAQRGQPVVVTSARDLRFTDNDLGDLANLLRKIPPYPMAYPNVVFAPPAPGQKRLNMLIIGDSFAQSFYGFYPYYQQLLTPDSRYWNYNKYVYWPEQTPGETRTVAEMDLRQQLRGRQAVLLVANEENLIQLGYGFIDQAFNLFFPLTAQDEARIAGFMQDMRNNPEWLGQLQAKATAQNVPLEQVMRNDALYMNDMER